MFLLSDGWSVQGMVWFPQIFEEEGGLAGRGEVVLARIAARLCEVSATMGNNGCVFQIGMQRQ